MLILRREITDIGTQLQDARAFSQYYRPLFWLNILLQIAVL